MTPDNVGQQLHDRATRGLALTSEEQTLLAEWYRRLDEVEAKQLASAQTPPDLEKLREEHRRLLSELVASAQRIEAKEAENERIRCEIGELRKELAKRRCRLPA